MEKLNHSDVVKYLQAHIGALAYENAVLKAQVEQLQIENEKLKKPEK